MTDFRAQRALGATRLENTRQRLNRAIHTRLEREQHQLAIKVNKLDLLSPLAVLGRGYALVKDEAGHLVTHADALGRGQKISVRFEKSEVGCRVVET